MNESQLITELSAALTDEAAAVRVPAGAAERARKIARGRRLKRGMAASVAAAGLAASLVVMLGGLREPAVHGRAPGVARNAHLTVARVLDRAAASAMAQSAIIPRPRQFVYRKTVDSVYGTAETWRSVDGIRNGFVLARGKKVMLWGCHHGWQTVRPDAGSGLTSIRQRCSADPAYLPGMPSRANDMQRYLTRKFGSRLRSAAVAQKVTEVLLEQDYLLPAQRAALYRYLVTIPGLKVVPHVRDYRGRPGVGVSVTTDGFTAMWIFDPNSYAYLGSADLVGGKLSSGSAILKTAIVDRTGQRSRG